jgi:hypothetical protein
MEGSFVRSRVWLSKGNKFQMGKMANYGNMNGKRFFSEIALKTKIVQKCLVSKNYENSIFFVVVVFPVVGEDHFVILENLLYFAPPYIETAATPMGLTALNHSKNSNGCLANL